MRSTLDFDFALKAVVGTGSPLLGVVTSMQEQIEWYLRVTSLVIGLMVGTATLVSMIRSWRK
jgi:hypothetical protein